MRKVNQTNDRRMASRNPKSKERTERLKSWRIAYKRKMNRLTSGGTPDPFHG